jgi:pilus assembly protein TadC
VAWLGIRRFLGRGNRSPVGPADQLGMAATWDLLAASLRAGLPVPTAVLAVADDLPAEAAGALRATADLLALGADPVAAWAPALDCPATAGLARGARRTARSGAALAGVASALATGIRAAASDVAEARAQRAGVLITGPLGLCFLPAFVCLGIVPVVVGLAAQLSVHP